MEQKENVNYQELVELFVRNGLEHPEIELDCQLLKTWAIVEDGEIRAGCNLVQNNDEFVLDNLAVDPDYRRKGWGKLLLDQVFAYLGTQKAQRLYIVTKVPSYFTRIGFYEIARGEAPDFSECSRCDQYMVDCFPKVMRKDL